MKAIKKWLLILKKAALEFLTDNGMKLSASLSYYTVFSLGPMLLIIISFAGIFFGHEAVQGELYDEIKGLIGSEAALQVQNIIAGIQQSQQGITGAIIGIGIFRALLITSGL